MELIYAALLLHKAGKEINAENIKRVADAAGISADDGQIKVLVAALDGVDIEKEIKEGAVMQAPAKAEEVKVEEKKEEKQEEKAEEAAAGLGALFG